MTPFMGRKFPTLSGIVSQLGKVSGEPPPCILPPNAHAPSRCSRFHQPSVQQGLCPGTWYFFCYFLQLGIWYLYGWSGQFCWLLFLILTIVKLFMILTIPAIFLILTFPQLSLKIVSSSLFARPAEPRWWQAGGHHHYRHHHHHHHNHHHLIHHHHYHNLCHHHHHHD